ncbi:hypothetical protein Dshi_3881 (plasmid) [Dinoroseobacter shibae DFL 12 = DSM 16493]|jgi:hypothetical protein|uniref:Uncharacterized protein n=1 Tax=Dinoroseobacter shibae (strain DSM 16493 / NCIMB 14021 / DFL 12) TaxID=398580 RepID=A8LTP2_DINSH|nr:hypothetical protein [Dinoroseobacter shibae]ABV95609.1 hypothetical protein Dshi_3881 [Dinoroseobacter shibae DFL 12 = DSM 16493]URF48817.1 hypothetical protein M8008_19915 [Dinoroseobacter shibae]URF53129.1 hypothetical protein M8007_19940 [Dinoroseobacter shibae]
MAEFDPDSSDVSPNGRKTGKTSSEQRQSDSNPDKQGGGNGRDHKATALAILDSKITRFLGLWALVTVLLVQIIKLFSRSFSFTENYSGILAITFILAAGIRYMAAQKLDLAGAVAVGVVLEGTVALFGLVGEFRRFGGPSCRTNRHSSTIASHET